MGVTCLVLIWMVLLVWSQLLEEWQCLLKLTYLFYSKLNGIYSMLTLNDKSYRKYKYISIFVFYVDLSLKSSQYQLSLGPGNAWLGNYLLNYIYNNHGKLSKRVCTSPADSGRMFHTCMTSKRPCSDVTLASWRLKSPATRSAVSYFIPYTAYHTEVDTRWQQFWQLFQMHFLVWKLWYFDSNFTGTHFLVSS